MPPSIEVQLAAEPRRKALVVSHERSGTHFLMNVLGRCFGYVEQPWVNLDFELGLNFHDREALGRFFHAFDGRPVLNVFKSHHAFGFFDGLLEEIRSEFYVFYVYRHPAAVMRSFRRYQRGVAWDDGPTSASVAEFLRAPPRGAMLRYQKEQAASVLHRWRDHVEGWTTRGVDAGVIPVRYEDLDRRFEESVVELGRHMGRAPERIERPSRQINVVQPPDPASAPGADAASGEEERILRREVGVTMARLGLDDP